ncbi:hypothetical protein D3C74_506670 [compost metagenome]
MHRFVLVVKLLISIDHHQLHINLEAAITAQIQQRLFEQEARLKLVRQRAIEAQAHTACREIVDP